MKKKYKGVTDEERDVFIFDLLPFIDASEAYYVDQFIRLKSGRKISWNWMAFLLGPLWCMYRKLYALGILHLIIVWGFSILKLSIYATLIFSAVFAMFANLFYLKIIEERLQEKQKLEEVDRVNFQTRNGGTTFVAPAILGAVIFIYGFISLIIQL